MALLLMNMGLIPLLYNLPRRGRPHGNSKKNSRHLGCQVPYHRKRWEKTPCEMLNMSWSWMGYISIMEGGNVCMQNLDRNWVNITLVLTPNMQEIHIFMAIQDLILWLTKCWMLKRFKKKGNTSSLLLCFIFWYKANL